MAVAVALSGAARQVYAEQEDIGVAEYERKVNEIVVLALGLRQRRRRRVQQPMLRLVTQQPRRG